jgi:MFS family permease
LDSRLVLIQVFQTSTDTLGALTYVAMGRLSDITQYRGPFAIGATLVSILGYCLLIANRSSAVSFAGCFFVAMGCYTAVGTPLAWLTSNNPRYGKRAFASGMQLTVGNSAGVAAPFLFQDFYAPTYYPGYAATIGLLCLSTTLFCVLHFHWRAVNKRRESGEEEWKAEGKTEEEVAELGDKSPRFVNTL